ncbi:delta(14)-sterol reductase LBR-like isoform X2 [Rhodnius prolixus]|uniref:delta(14)-sterol reductase LBR-like isoform X2 n=1 Tax=Rhodnius prolixus TaxID=13249 RepID=UPI003D18B048
MDSSRSVRQVRKSPVRYFAEVPTKRDRSRSRGRKPKSPERGSKKSELSDVPKPEKPRRRSSSRNAKAPRSPGRKKTIEEKDIKKKPSPVSSFESRSTRLETIIRSSISPDRAKLEEVMRSSASRFEEVIADIAPNIKRRSKRIISNTMDSGKVGSEGLEYMTNFSEKNDLMDKEIKAINSFNNNTKNYNVNNNYKEFGGLLGAFCLILLMPLVVIAAQLFCTQENCVPVPTKAVVLSLRRFFDADTIFWYTGFFVTQLLLSAVPLGPRLYAVGSKGFGLSYWRNGPASVILTVSFLAALKYFFSFPVVKLLDKSMPFLISSIIFALVLTIFLYFFPNKEEDNKNPYAQSGNVIYDLWMGRDINPKWGPVDIKISLIRCSLLLVLVYNGLLIMKEIESKPVPSDYSVTLLVMCALQIIFALDPLICESSLISSYIIVQEGTGYHLIMTLAVLPFWITLIPKYLYFSKPQHNYWVIALTSLLFLAGYGIYRISCWQRDNFLRNSTSLKRSDAQLTIMSATLFNYGEVNRQDIV